MVKVHQSAVNNLLGSILGATTLKRDAYDADPVLIGAVKPAFMDKGKRASRSGNLQALVDPFPRWSANLMCLRPGPPKGLDPCRSNRSRWREVRWLGSEHYLQAHLGRWKLDACSGRGRSMFCLLPLTQTLAERFRPGHLLYVAIWSKPSNERDDRLPKEIDLGQIDLSDRDGPLDMLVFEDIQFIDGWMVAGLRAF